MDLSLRVKTTPGLQTQKNFNLRVVTSLVVERAPQESIDLGLIS